MSLELPIMSDIPTDSRQAKTLHQAVSGLSGAAQATAETANQAVVLMGKWSQYGAVGILGAVALILVTAGLITSYLTSKADRAQAADGIRMTIQAQQTNVETLAKSQEKQIEQISRTWEAQTRAMIGAVELNTRSVEKMAEKIDRRQEAIQKQLSNDGK
jgi:hypothetical protein